MKALLRSAPVQAALGAILAAYGALITATLRWRVLDLAAAEAALSGPRGAIALFWHGQIAGAIACRPVLRGRRAQVMISLSRDGGFIARTAQALGVGVIRGSTGRPGEAALDKGGAAALRAAVQAISRGEIMLITPDGPRGPFQTLSAGPVHLARAGRAPVFAVGVATSPSIALNSWDKARLPLPFARAAAVVRGPFTAPAAASAEAVEALRAAWEQELRAAQRAAEAALAAAR